MKKGRILIADDVHIHLIQGLIQRGHRVDYFPDIIHNDVLERIGNYTGLIINSSVKANRALLDAAGQLKFIARLGSGLEIIDQPYAKQKNIMVINSPEGNSNAVAEHALSMLLALLNHLIKADHEVRNKIWKREENRGMEFEGKTVGIIGFGNTGEKFAEKLGGFNVKILVYDKYRKDITAEEHKVMVMNDMKDVLQEADVISLHLPLTNETEYLVNREWLSMCKKGAILINISRGKIVRLEDLITALNDGQLYGACLDVFENEKPDTYTDKENVLYKQLFENSRVVLSPHIAGWTFESKRKIAEVLLDKIDTLN